MASRQRGFKPRSWSRLKGTEPALRADPTLRDANTVIAIKLLPLFEANPDGWRLLTFLNKGPRGGDETLAHGLRGGGPNRRKASGLLWPSLRRFLESSPKNL